MRINFSNLIQELEFLDAERKHLAAIGPHFIIIHRFRKPGTVCESGEEVVAVYLVHDGREFFLPLSLALRLLFDFLANHRHMPQSASQIQAAMRRDAFYTRHGFNAGKDSRLTRKITRSAVKRYVTLIRRALDLAFKKAHLSLDPLSIMRADSNQ